MPRFYKIDAEKTAFSLAEKQIHKALERGNAKKLSLTGRNLAELPESIGQLTGLLELYLGRNKLKWADEIKRKLEDADLYLFLMSVDLLNSDYVQHTELPIARKRHEENKARLVPVVVRRCGWARYVGDIQGLPKEGRPIKPWPDKDQACFDVEEGLRKTIEEVRKMLGKT